MPAGRQPDVEEDTGGWGWRRPGVRRTEVTQVSPHVVGPECPRGGAGHGVEVDRATKPEPQRRDEVLCKRRTGARTYKHGDIACGQSYTIHRT